MIELKNHSEIEIMSEGGKRLKKILDSIIKKIKPGINSLEIDALAKKLILKSGGKPSFLNFKGYPAVICISINSDIVHSIPQNRIIKEGDIVSIDLGLEYKGFHTDIATTVAIGKVDKLHQKLISSTKKALQNGIKKACEGNHISDIGHEIEKTITEAGFYPIRECTGHGIGRLLHEDPNVPNFGEIGRGEILKAGMVIAIEPMASVDRTAVVTGSDGWLIETANKSYAAHFESTVAITKKKAKILA